MGVAVVSTAVGGPAEIIRDGIDGVLVAPRHAHALAVAIGGLLDEPATRHALGQAARASAIERFGAHQHVAEVTSLYHEVLGDRAMAARGGGHMQPLESLDWQTYGCPRP